MWCEKFPLLQETTMADVKMPKSIPCKFDQAWIGKCRKPSTNGWCSKHEKLKCAVCGKQATHECEHTGSSPFVCGEKLCDSCKHEPFIPGEVPYPSRHVLPTEYKVMLERARIALDRA